MKPPKWTIDFWKKSTKSFLDYAFLEMVESGFTPERAQELLEELYGTIGEEYGG